MSMYSVNDSDNSKPYNPNAVNSHEALTNGCNCKCYEAQIKEMHGQIDELRNVIKTLVKHIK